MNKLNNMGFNVQRHEIFTTLKACRNLVASKGLRFIDNDARYHFTLPESFNSDILTNDRSITQTSPPTRRYIARGIRRYIARGIRRYSHQRTEQCRYHWAQPDLNKAFHLILNGAPLIAGHKAQWADREGEVDLGPGAFVTGLEYATGTAAVIAGKPSKSFYELVLEDIGCLDCPQKVVMIGDNIHSDFGHSAHELGLIRYLVKTGKYRDGDENKTDEKGVHGVDGIFDNFERAVDHIVGGRSSAPLLLLEDIAREEFDGIPTGEPNNAVVIGLSPTSFRYELVGV
ncbi:hypothetical protein BC936DRAFT_138873 [Jimgerdemannia flammicorona]|uniref:HAD-like domain-containing protein n=1 Tax=Jimgerdemannia flammicorona TaxID=994334 RepID=A0A433DI16_9FUNG|nr:hypothetical protein BC936DRAFT_138873 [Jimgerdemannia flammicorona]